MNKEPDFDRLIEAAHQIVEVIRQVVQVLAELATIVAKKIVSVYRAVADSLDLRTVAGELTIRNYPVWFVDRRWPFERLPTVVMI